MIEAIKQIDGYESMTPAEIADALRAITVTYHAVDLGELMFMMNARNMLTRTLYPDADGIKWVGTVVNMVKYVRGNVPPLVGPVNQFYSHITFEKNRNFDTSLVQYGSQLAALAANFGGKVIGEEPNQLVMPSVEDFQAIAELGGGWLYASVTPEQVTAALNAEQLVAIHEATIQPLQSKLNAISTWLNTDEALAMSVTDYQAYADSLLATDDGNPSGGE